MMFDTIYQFLLNALLSGKIILATLLLIILLSQRLFMDAPRWRWVFVAGVIIYNFGLMADLVDGSSDLYNLRLYAFGRHVGSFMLLLGVLGMHWPIFRGPLLRGSIFSRYLPVDDAQSTHTERK